MRAYRALLRLYPAAFRAEYGREMGEDFARRTRGESGLGKVRAWAEAIADTLRNAPAVHADVLAQDLRATLRGLRRVPGFALTVVVVGALGIAATTSAFSLADHLLVRPLPYPRAERLFRIYQGQRSGGYSELSPGNFDDVRRGATSFETMAASFSVSVNLVSPGEPERLESARVTVDLLPTLGVRPLLGRPFSEADAAFGAAGTVLLGHSFWMRRFGGDASVVGRTLILDGEPHQVLGVLPPSFAYPSRATQVWTALRLPPGALDARDDRFLVGLGRLKDGVDVADARAEMAVLAAQLEKAHPEANAGLVPAVFGLRDELSSQARVTVLGLLGASACVLLTACTNLASLLMSRAASRRAELAVRTSLGAGRGRLVRQLLTESVVLAGAGGIAGVGLALLATPLLARLVPGNLPVAGPPAVDLRVMLFAAALSVITGIAFGVLPAFRALVPPADGLRAGSRGSVGSGDRLRAGLVVAQVAASLVLLVGGGLMLRALARVSAVDPGFSAGGVVTLRTILPFPKYETTLARHLFYERVLAEARALPGVTGAAYTSGLPMVARGGLWPVETGDAPRDGEPLMASLRFVTPGFFATLGIPVLRGRDVRPDDTTQSLPVAVVSASFARRHWPGLDPLGRRLRFGPRGQFPERTVVGVVADVRVRGLERTSEPQLYLAEPQVGDGSLIGYTPRDLVVRAGTDAASLIPALRAIVQRADPEQPVSDPRPVAAILEAETAPRAVQVRVLGGFAAMATLLAGVGIYGLLAFAVASRRREIGVRLALGAQPADVLNLVVGRGLRLAAGGVALGLPLAWAAARAIESLLAGVSPLDPGVYGVATLLALLVSGAGCLLPGRRAARVDPVVALAP